jgi:hypothetical protein
VELTSGGKLLGYSADHWTGPRKTGLPALERFRPAAYSEA